MTEQKDINKAIESIADYYQIPEQALEQTNQQKDTK